MEKPRRVHPWRDEYTREFGVRVVERDAGSGDVLLVECRFCAAFGREQRVAGGAPSSPTEASSRKRPRARSRSVATWKKSFRSDNMRSHHVEQHPQRWAAYQRLLALVKQEHVRQLAVRSSSDGEGAAAAVAEDQLEAFFTPGEREERASAADRTAAAAALRRAEPKARRAEAGACECAGAQSALLLAEISDPAIVDKLVSRLTDVSSKDVAAASCLLAPVFAGDPSATAPKQDVVKYQVSLVSERAFVFCLRVLALDDTTTFQQLASIMAIAREHCAHFGATSSASAGISSADTREFAQLIVMMDLQMLAVVMRASWTYSLALRNTRVAGARGEASVLEVRLRVISARSNAHVNEFHVFALPLHRQSEAAPCLQVCAAFLRETLSILDPKWRRKMLGGWVGGCLANFESASTVFDHVVSDAATTVPFYETWHGALFVGRAVQQALQELVDGTSDDDEAIGFAVLMERALAYLRTQYSWIQSHGSELPDPTSSALWTDDARKADASPWLLLETLQWFVARREAIGQLYTEANAPPRVRLTSEWWLVCLALTDLLSGYASTASVLGRESGAQPGSASCGRRKLAEFVHTQVEKLGLESLLSGEFGDSSASHGTTPDEDSGVQRGRLHWPTAKIVAFFRSLNLSTRRLYAQLSDIEKHSVQRQIGRFVVHTLDSMSRFSDRSVRLPGQETVGEEPADEAAALLPTRPLDFVAIERDAVVDFIEHHSARLEVSYGMASIDELTNEIKDLRDAVAADPILKAALMTAASASSSSFGDSWEPVRTRFERVRTLAAGFATTTPTALASSRYLRENDLDSQWSRVSGSNRPLLFTEARLHARQFVEVEGAYKTYQ